MKKGVLYRLILALIFLLALYSPAALSGGATLTPLLDTPGNRAYYSAVSAAVKEAESSVMVMMATADYYPEYGDGIQDSLYDALVDARNRGIEVKMLLDASNWSEDITRTNRKTANYLKDRGIDVRLDDPEVTTHAKLVVVDRRVVLLGSSNWNYPTYTESYQTNVKLVNREVGGFYARYFRTVWQGDDLSVAEVPAELPDRTCIVPLVSFGEERNYFEAAKKLIDGAERSIELVIFKITRYAGYGESKSNLLTEALVAAEERGVDVKIVLDVNDWSGDTNQSNRETTLWLLGQGVDTVRFDDRDATTHAKLLIVDEESILLGSTNWSYYSLEKNVEADVLIKDSPKVAEKYGVYFNRLWKEATLPDRETLTGG